MNNRTLTLGSLFSGSGGFEFGGLLCGIQPLWASEVEPFPIRVTTKRMPQVKHLGDICKINGADIPPVDIVTFGSPCQSFSVAGKREGMEGKSGLFYEAVRVIREMYIATEGSFPTFAVMENVPGIFSSKTNGKSDFLEVLNELISIKQDKTLSVPLPQTGTWSTSGEIVGDGFSIGWRTVDAQFWGVAQRRRRCYLVLDLAGERAGKILFDESCLRGNSAKSGGAGQATAGGSAAGFGGAVTVLNDQGGSVMEVSENISGTLRAQEHGHQPIVFEPGALSRLGKKGAVDKAICLRADMGDNQLAVAIENRPQDSRLKIKEDGICQTLDARMGEGGGNVPLVMNERQFAMPVGEDVAYTLTATDFKGVQCVCESKNTAERHSDCYQYNIGVPQQQQIEEGKAVVERVVAENYQYGGYREVDKAGPLKASGGDCPGGENVVIENRYIVRRLTPTECALLQGFPSDWCAGLETPKPTKEDMIFWYKVWETHRIITGSSETPKSRRQVYKWLKDPHSDAAEYKMWGNGVCLHNVVFFLDGIVKFGTPKVQ